MRWRWWMRRIRDDSDTRSANEQREKLAQARRETGWIVRVAAPELARLPADQFVERVRSAMTLRVDH